MRRFCENASLIEAFVYGKSATQRPLTDPDVDRGADASANVSAYESHWMRHQTGPRCEGCFLKPSLCMCALLPRLQTRTRVIVIMHSLEQHKTTNTGKLAHACLPNSEIVMFGRDQASPLGARPWASTLTPVVLFPVAGAQQVAEFRGTGDLALVALDGNWRQAARLRKRFAAQNIPFVCAPVGLPSMYRLRTEPHANGVSTFEAIARSLAVLEDHDMSPLLQALRVFQDRTLWARGSLPGADVEGGVPAGAARHSRT